MKKLTFYSKLIASFLLVVLASDLYAHGERAQQPGLRMRTVHFFDTEIFPTTLKVNEMLTIKGKFIPSEYWPEHIPSIENMAYLNVGVPGPTFLRMYSAVNGVPMIRSTSFKKGELYEYELQLKARTAGEYHVHTVISVEGAGPIISSGLWVTVEEGDEPFENTLTTLLGDEIDMETYGLKNVIFWTVLWFAIAVGWFAYWLKKMPILFPRIKQVDKMVAAGENPNDMISRSDRIAGVVVLSITLVLIAVGFIWAENNYPVTTPLQTGKVETPLIDWEKNAIELELIDARYRIPGRSFRVELKATNTLNKDVRLADFITANLRFANPKVREVKAVDSHDLVAETGLVVEDDLLEAGETRTLVFEANDALWETYRLTSLIFDPDSRFAGMLFFEAADGQRYPVEIGGAMLPVFN